MCIRDSPDYDSVKKRAAQAAVLVPLVRQALSRASAREWAERFGQSVPCAEVRPVEDMFDHPQVQAMGLMRPYHNPQAGDYLGLAQWAHFGGAAPVSYTHLDVYKRQPLSLPPNFRRLPKRYIRFPSSKMETSRLRYRIRQSCGDSLKMGRRTCSPGISAMAAAPCSCNTLSAPVTS